ncbi:SpoIIE family protein phosphatase [Yinghuangia seranimata]|uniref:SpoIIE family protein phosphatase n=1 Tax=Yinghuangia seranimata TaxID=408067 RepID=UPI00248AF9AB|nr:SpoIIE family protein phosphatase [Yinghuangia seranimata]MDI2129010.1 SpoIIE family protein phosphatase [Yinghuangia seranimata]
MVRPSRQSRPSQSRSRRPRLPRSIAAQVFLLQVVVVLVLVAAVVAVLVWQARRDAEREARYRSEAVAQTFANAPGTIAAMQGPDPSSVLQPAAEAARVRTGVDFVAVVSNDGTRYADPNPQLLGQRIVDPALQAVLRLDVAVSTTHSTDRGLSVVTAVPVHDAQGTSLGLVAAGITVGRVNSMVAGRVWVVIGGGVAALALCAGGAALISRRLRRQTHGLDPAEVTRMYEHHDAVLHAVREGVLITGGDGRIVLANDEARRLLSAPDPEGRTVQELHLEPGLTRLLESGREATDEVHAAGGRLLAVNKRPTDPYGSAGSVATLRDTTELQELTGRAEVTRRRLSLLYEAGLHVGTTLDIARTADELAEISIPRFADIVTVDLLDPVLTGEEPPPAGTRMRRVTARSAGFATPPPLQPAGDMIVFPPTTAMATALARGRAVLQADLHTSGVRRAPYPDQAHGLLDAGVHSLLTVPLQARGTVLGLVTFWRGPDSPPFEHDDVSFAEEIAARAAVAIDNARRYTREHTMAVTLQRSLLPRGLPEQGALEAAYRYLPARAGVGGDWFDVIPLPGARVALVVGDVVGHGLHAAATMGRLRTAVHNFSGLDLPPDEMLGHLDDLVSSIDRDQPEHDGDEAQITGATCLYAVYDPVSGRATVARAGHPGPALVTPDGTVAFPDVPVSLPLGLNGSRPIDSIDLDLPQGSRLVLYTDGLVEGRGRDLGTGLEMLRAALASTGPDADPEQTCDAVITAMLGPRTSDDIALLVARTRVVAPERVAVWEVSSDPAAVSTARAEADRQLTAWGLDGMAFTTELVLSELVTNAIRYGNQPIGVRLIHDRTLICEVSDGSSTAPHLRRAATTDEGGRGLFLVAKFATRWGTRYTLQGKVIWAELPIQEGIDASGEDVTDALLDQWDDTGW